MADAQSRRGLRAAARARGSRHRANTRFRRRGQTSTSAHRARAGSPTLTSELARVARELEIVYCTVVTAQCALEGQNADRDLEIAQCLLHHVANPLSAQVEKLKALSQRG